MIQAISAITYIENGLRQLLASGQLFGKINRSNTTLSVYLNTKAPTNPPQKSVRSSNHHANMQNMLTGRRKPWNTKNISIEFYEPQFLKSGKPLPNVLLTRVRQLPNNPTIKPFNLTIYEYRAAEMDMPDIDAIFKEIMNFVNSGFYKDPFINTEKMANVTTREADIPGAVTPTKNDVQMNISNGEYGADNVVDETKRRTITLSEGKLRSIIRESLVETMGVLEEGKFGRALGAAALGAGLMIGHPQDANAQLQFKSISRNEQPKQPQCPVDREQLSRYNTIVHEHRPNSPDWEYYYIECNGYRFVLSRPTFCEISAKESTEMLKSFLHIIDSKIATAYSVCPNKHEYCFKYIPDKNAVSFSCTEEKGGSFILTKSEILKAISFIEINQLAWDMYNEEYRKSIRDLESRRNMAPSR